MTETPAPYGPFDSLTPGAALRKVLDSHGFGFQYRTLETCLAIGGLNPWKFSVAEYAVTLHGIETHIDFVLGSGTHLLVAECKRVNPRLGRWAFIRASALRDRTEQFGPRIDYLTWNATQEELVREVRTAGPKQSPYDVVVELRVDEKGDSASTGRDMDKAVNQVMRGRSGLMEDLHKRGRTLRYGGGAIVPVIFTTAELWATEADLASADQGTGKFPEMNAVKAPWLWYDVSLSASLRPNVPWVRVAEQRGPNKTDLLRQNFWRDMRRSIAVVSVDGIAAFLENLRRYLDSPGEREA